MNSIEPNSCQTQLGMIIEEYDHEMCSNSFKFLMLRIPIDLPNRGLGHVNLGLEKARPERAKGTYIIIIIIII